MESTSELEEILKNLGERISVLEAQNLELHAQNTTLSDTIHQLQELASAKPGKYEPKIADPEHFTGNRAQVMDFLSKCRLKFAGQPSRFPTERIKVLYAGSYLKDQAYSWFQPLLNAVYDPNQHDPAELDSFELFSDALITIYGDPDLMATAERQISNLKHTDSVAKYHAEFTRLRQYVKWNEDALKNTFYMGLKEHIKDWLSTQDRPNTLKDLVDKTLRYDARKYERFQEKRTPNTRWTSSSPAPTSFPFTGSPRSASNPPRQDSPMTTPRAQTQSADGTTPMELGSRRISEAEKERRRINRLCYYCGQANHTALNCPVRPNRIPFLEMTIEEPISLEASGSAKASTQE